MLNALQKSKAIVISRHKATKEYFNDLPQLDRLDSPDQLEGYDSIIGNLPLGVIRELPGNIYYVHVLTFPNAEKGKEYTKEEFEKGCKLISFMRPHPYGENADCRWLMA